jgi:transcriptional regulator with XRE-family HTH domain
MELSKHVSAETVLSELGGRLARIRLDRNLTQAELAEQAGVSKRTVERLESGAAATQLSGFLRVCRALGLLERFDALVPEAQPSPIAQLKLRGKQRRRASSGKTPHPPVRKWTWGD